MKKNTGIEFPAAGPEWNDFAFEGLVHGEVIIIILNL